MAEVVRDALFVRDVLGLLVRPGMVWMFIAVLDDTEGVTSSENALIFQRELAITMFAITFY